MQTIPPGLRAGLDSGATTLCHGWRMVRRDGAVLGFTDHDRDLELEGVVFAAASGVAGSESVQELGLAVSGAELSGALSGDAITAADLAAGRYDGARIDHLLMDWTAPENHLLLRRCVLGEVRSEGAHFIAELRALADRLNQTGGRIYSAACDADLGDARCGVDLAHSAHQGEGTVSAANGRLQVTVPALSGFAAGLFAHGRLTFTSGANAGFACEVKAHGAGGVLSLWQPAPEDIAAGDAIAVTAGCDKRFSTCRDRFGNQLNFRGCPHMPGNDYVLTVAVSGEAGYDGGVAS